MAHQDAGLAEIPADIRLDRIELDEPHVGADQFVLVRQTVTTGAFHHPMGQLDEVGKRKGFVERLTAGDEGLDLFDLFQIADLEKGILDA